MNKSCDHNFITIRYIILSISYKKNCVHFLVTWCMFNYIIEYFIPNKTNNIRVIILLLKYAIYRN